jgi:hypothetical protein
MDRTRYSDTRHSRRHDDRVKGPPGRLLHQRHNQHEDNGSHDGTDVIRDEKRRKDS